MGFQDDAQPYDQHGPPNSCAAEFPPGFALRRPVTFTLGIMNSACLSSAEQQQVLLAMNYWRTHWDWERPLLFGIEFEDLEHVIRSWPNTTAELREKQALAAVSSLRELLYGASTPQKDKLPSILGLDFSSAGMLCTKVHSLFRVE